MPQPPEKKPLSEADFEAIAEAVNETERGRWFLNEYTRRNRHADTRLVLEAIRKLQETLAGRANDVSAEQIRHEIAGMSEAIARTKAEIAAIKPQGEGLGKIGDATIELDAIVETTERATSDILAAAERVQEIAWTLREQGIDPSVCDLLDLHTTQTYTACSFQDLTGQRIRKIVNVLNFLEARIEAMNRIWRHLGTAATAETAVEEPPSLVNGPARPGEGLQQITIDGILENDFPGDDLAGDICWQDAPEDDGGENAEPVQKPEQELEQEPDQEPDRASDREPEEQSAESRAAETSPKPEPEPEPERAPAPAPQPTRARPAPPPSAPVREAAPDPIESLTPAERLALFS